MISKRTVRQVLKSQLNGKSEASTRVLPPRYPAGIITWPKEEIEDNDSKIVMNC